MTDIIVVTVLAIAVFFIVRSQLHRLRSGQCCGGCGGCTGSCTGCQGGMDAPEGNEEDRKTKMHFRRMRSSEVHFPAFEFLAPF